MADTYYRLLGLAADAEPEQIKPAAQAAIGRIKAAFAVLGNADKRKEYDAQAAADEPGNHYAVLGLSRHAPPQAIRGAAQSLLEKIKAAYEILNDAEQRRRYDASLAPTPEKSAPPPLVLKQKPAPTLVLKEKSAPRQQASDYNPFTPPPPRPEPRSDYNPYQPPEAEVDDILEGEFELAGRGSRLAAALLDGLLMILPVFLAILGPLMLQQESDDLSNLVWLAIPVALWFLGVLIANLMLLYRNGQTIGKYALKIKIVRSDGSRAGLLRIIFMRGLVINLIAGLAGLVIQALNNLITLVNILFIFRPDRRCLHDLIADTIVVKAGR